MRRICLLVVAILCTGLLTAPGASAGKPVPLEITGISGYAEGPATLTCGFHVTVTYTGTLKNTSKVSWGLFGLSGGTGGSAQQLGTSPFQAVSVGVNLSDMPTTAMTSYFTVNLYNGNKLADTRRTVDFSLLGCPTAGLLVTGLEPLPPQ